MVVVTVWLGVAMVASLHLLRTDVSPVSDRLSLYALGPHSWLMAAALGAMALALVALAARLRQVPTQGLGRTTPWLLILAALGLGLSAVFPVSVSVTSDRWHSWASTIAALALVSAALTWSVPRQRPSGALRSLPLDAWAAVVAGTLLALSPLLHHSRVAGVGQRLLWAAVTAWVLLAGAKRVDRHVRAR